MDPAATAGLLALSAVILALEAFCSGALRAWTGILGLGVARGALAGLDGLPLVEYTEPGPLRAGAIVVRDHRHRVRDYRFPRAQPSDLHHYVGGSLQTLWILMALLLSARLSEEQETYAVDREIGPGARLGLILGTAAVVLLVPALVTVLDTAGRVVRRTEPCSQLTGLLANAIGRPFVEEFLGEEDHAWWRANCTKPRRAWSRASRDSWRSAAAARGA